MVVSGTHFLQARKSEEKYHNDLYTTQELFQEGSWLAKSVRFVQNALEDQLTVSDSSLQILDLGCGVGRNSIMMAEMIQSMDGHVTGVDYLSSAIEGLKKYSEQYGVSDHITPILADVEKFDFGQSVYDFIVSVSCIEHVSTKQSFCSLLDRMIRGTKKQGSNCFMINTGISWFEKETKTKDSTK